ncbi:ankyrin repeat-containing domain protein [Morchella snyderi]|nr:ankyrin repeat-containing domain protein [Morchella snyderi]
MDVAGSMVGLLAIGYQIYKSLDEFVSICKDAPTIAKDTRDQVNAFRYSLQKLAPYIRETAEITSLGRSNTDINQLKITLASSVDTFSQTQKLLDRLSPRKQEKMDYRGRIRWAMAEGNLNKLLSRIDESSAQTESCVDRLNDLLTSIMAPGGALEAPPLPFNLSTDALSLNHHGGHISTQEIQRGLASPADDSVSIISTTRSLGGRSRRNFESILMKSRAYRNRDIIADSRASVSTSQRHTHWSLFSGGSNTSVFSLCYTGFENSGRTLAEESDLCQIPLPLHIGSLHNQFWYPPSASSIESDVRILSPRLKPSLGFRPHPTKITGFIDDQNGRMVWSGVGGSLGLMVDELYCSSGSCEDFTLSYRKHLQDACLEGDLRKMEILFGWEAEMMRVHPQWKHNGFVINYRWETVEGESILGPAIKDCNSEMVEMNLDRGAGVNQPFADRPMALQMAIETNNAAIVHLLLVRGADVNHLSQSASAMLLLMAVMAGNELMLEVVLDRGVDANYPSVHGSTALQAAIETKDLAIVRILLDRGADINRCSKYVFSMLVLVAVRAKDEAIVQMILDRGAKIYSGLVGGSADVGESLAFMVDELSRSSGSCGDFTVCSGKHIQDACLEGDLRKMEILFGWEVEMMRVHPEWKHKGDTISYTWETADGESILALAIKDCNSEMVEMILDRGAGVNHLFAESPTALQTAIRINNVAIVQILLDRGADVNLCSHSTPTIPLIMAVQAKNEAMVKMILDRGADINHVFLYGPTALQVAIGTEEVAIVQILLDRGADVNLWSHSTSTMPLVIAVQAKNEAMVEMILGQGARAHGGLKGVSEALLVAIEADCSAIVKMLLDQGAEVNPRSQFTSITPLALAVKANNEAMVEMILDRGADIDHRSHPDILNRGTDIKRRSESALIMLLYVAVGAKNAATLDMILDHYAKGYGRLKGISEALRIAIEAKDEAMVEMLLDRGADINNPFVGRTTALQAAIEINNLVIVQILLNRGADVNLCSCTTSTRPLVMAVQGKNEAMVEVILECDTKTRGGFKGFPEAIVIAIEANSIVIAKMLLDRCVNVNPRSQFTSTILVLAVKAKNEVMGRDDLGSSSAIVKMLLDQGAEVNPRSQFTSITPLALAVKANNEAMVEMILDQGADIDHRSQYGSTALEVAIMANHVAIVQILLNRGADVYAQAYPYNWCCKTVLDVAAKCGQPEIYALVLERSLKVERRTSQR